MTDPSVPENVRVRVRVCDHCHRVFTRGIWRPTLKYTFCSRTCHSAHRRGLLEERFWASFEKTDGCWEWQGRKDGKGYGLLTGTYQGRKLNWLAHRLSWLLHGGSLPPSMTIDHLCRVHGCVNPAHLEVVTIGENVRRGESFSTQHRRKTHCPYGHPYDEANTYHIPSGGRGCTECRRRNTREAARRRYQRIKHGNDNAGS
jgi:hypothetical protein